MVVAYVWQKTTASAFPDLWKTKNIVEKRRYQVADRRFKREENEWQHLPGSLRFASPFVLDKNKEIMLCVCNSLKTCWDRKVGRKEEAEEKERESMREKQERGAVGGDRMDTRMWGTVKIVRAKREGGCADIPSS